MSMDLAQRQVFEAQDYMQKARALLMEGELESAFDLYEMVLELCDMASDNDPAAGQSDMAERVRSVAKWRLDPTGSTQFGFAAERKQLREAILAAPETWRRTIVTRKQTLSIWRELAQGSVAARSDDPITTLIYLVHRLLSWMEEDKRGAVLSALIIPAWYNRPLSLKRDSEIVRDSATRLLGNGGCYDGRRLVDEIAGVLYRGRKQDNYKMFLLHSSHGLRSIATASGQRPYSETAALYAQEASLLACASEDHVVYNEATILAALCLAQQRTGNEVQPVIAVTMQHIEQALAEFREQWYLVIGHDLGDVATSARPLELLTAALDDEVLTIKEGHRLVRGLTEASGVAFVMHMIADWLLENGDLPTARSHYVRAYEIAHWLWEPNEMALSKLGLAQVALRERNDEEAQGHLQELANLLSDRVDPFIIVDVYSGMGDIYLDLGNWQQANFYYEASAASEMQAR